LIVLFSNKTINSIYKQYDWQNVSQIYSALSIVFTCNFTATNRPEYEFLTPKHNLQHEVLVPCWVIPSDSHCGWLNILKL